MRSLPEAWARRWGASDTTAPTLTFPNTLPLGDTSGYLGVTTNEANGTLYYVVTTSATPPSAAQVKAGENNGGTAAVYAGSQAISSTGAKNATATGLSSATAYYAYFMHEDAAGNQSSVSSSATFTTLTTGTSDTDFDNLIAAASKAPADLRKGYIARFIGALYAASVWTKIDVMWVLAAHNEQFGRLNWKSPGSFTLTAVNSPTFTTDRGFTGVQASSTLLDTGWDWATNGVGYTQNNCHLSNYQRSGGEGVASFSQQNASWRGGVGGRPTTAAPSRVNSATNISVTSGSYPIQTIARRNDSTNASLVRDGAQVLAPTAAASTTGANTSDFAFFIGGNRLRQPADRRRVARRLPRRHGVGGILRRVERIHGRPRCRHMTDVLILTAEEADKVRGRSPKNAGHAIRPTLLKDGRFFLGLEVLDDPAHEDVRDFLAAMPREPLEKLPVYTEEDAEPEAVEVASLTERTLTQSLDRLRILEQKAAIAKEDAGAVLKDDAGSVAVEIDAVKSTT
jgi:hypothetical protein